MVRAFVLYDEAPDPERYAAHVDDSVRRCPARRSGTARVFGAPMGEPKFALLRGVGVADMDAFKTASRSEEFMATGKDAMEMGGRFTVHFAER